MRRLGRRGFLAAAAAGTVGAAAAASVPARPARAQAARSFTRVIDLTHPLGPDFPTFAGQPQLRMERMTTLEKDGYNMFRWHVVEHTGTHMDAPIHFGRDGEAETGDQVPAAHLVVPLAVVDIRRKAAANPDAQLTPDDLRAWEAANGRLPAGACVAMLSGWDAHLMTPKFRGADAEGTMHFPGFHPEAAAMLMEERNALGIAVDTLSLDHGASKDFAVHYAWLPSNRWGIEAVAHLADLPASGATLVLGNVPIKGATGGPCRVLALA